MLETLFFNWIPIGISIVGLIITVYMLKYRQKSTSEKVYDANRKSAIDCIFNDLGEIDNHKLAIYANMEVCTNIENSKLRYTNEIFYNIEAHQEEIKSEGEQLLKYVKLSAYVTEPQYELIKGYVWSAYSFIELADPGFYEINKNVLEFHKYNAYKIVEQFGKLIDKDFKSKWQVEFANGITPLNKINLDDAYYRNIEEMEVYGTDNNDSTVLAPLTSPKYTRVKINM